MNINFEQSVSWIVLILILISMIFSKIRYELVALGGLFLLGLLKVSAPAELFSGFSNPALFTVIIVLVMSEGIVESGILTGLGKSIARKIRSPEKQILAISLTAWFLSAFMNNVGAVGLVLPTARRMAKRAGVEKSHFGLPLSYAAILGGSVTLIGTAPNLIVSTFRYHALGRPFSMFDFTAHGMAMSLSSLALWFMCRLCGYSPLKSKKGGAENIDTDSEELLIPETGAARSTKNTVIVLASILPAIAVTSAGLIHPSVAFGLIVLLWIAAGVFTQQKALSAVNIPIFIFLGSMLSISEILNKTQALPGLVDAAVPLVSDLPVFLLVAAFVFITAFLSNIINNSAAAVLMAPAAVLLHTSGASAAGVDALLMAVAAGANLSIVMPTHQSTIVAMNSMGFSRKDFIKKGAVITLVAGLAASYVIFLVWS